MREREWRRLKSDVNGKEITNVNGFEAGLDVGAGRSAKICKVDGETREQWVIKMAKGFFFLSFFFCNKREIKESNRKWNVDGLEIEC